MPVGRRGDADRAHGALIRQYSTGCSHVPDEAEGEGAQAADTEAGAGAPATDTEAGAGAPDANGAAGAEEAEAGAPPQAG